MAYIGIDLGATKTVVAFSGSDCSIIMSERIETAHCMDFSQNARDIFSLIDKMLVGLNLSYSDIEAIGLCCPGPLDLKNGRIIKVATADWTDVPVKEIFTRKFGVPVALQNDAAGAAYAEYTSGAGRGSQNMLYLTVSTGIGGGIIIGGRIYDGINGCAGEFGHITVNPGGLLCNCGGRGCLELYSSGTAIARDAAQRVAGGKKSILSSIPEITARDVVAAYREKDSLAISVFDNAMDILGIATANLFHAFAPDAFVFGGGVSNDFDVMKERIEASARSHMFLALQDLLVLRKASLGDMAGITGALLLARDIFLGGTTI